MTPPCTAPLPKSLRIGPFDFQIIEYHPMSAAACRRYGEFSSMEVCIRIDPQAGCVKTVDTLIHELTHAIYWTYGIDDKDKEERVAGFMGTAWTQIYRDNPDLLRFIGEALHPKPFELPDLTIPTLKP